VYIITSRVWPYMRIHLAPLQRGWSSLRRKCSKYFGYGHKFWRTKTPLLCTSTRHARRERSCVWLVDGVNEEIAKSSNWWS